MQNRVLKLVPDKFSDQAVVENIKNIIRRLKQIQFNSLDIDAVDTTRHRF
jgi:hypothetical protein